jgi:WD40 repeat protein
MRNVQMTPKTRAVVIVFAGIVVEILGNLAFNGFDPGYWRWLLIGAILAACLTLLALSIRSMPATTTAHHEHRDWMLPSTEELIDRPGLRETVSSLLTSGDVTFVGLTALYGAGGFGKTTLTVLVCSQDMVRSSFPGGLLWATIGQERQASDLAAIANDLSEQLSGERPHFSDLEQAGRHLGNLLDARERNLLVIDDVWSADQLRPFMFGGKKTTRLVTTRNPEVLPRTAKAVCVDEMDGGESRELLNRGLSKELSANISDRLQRLAGNWPLLISMINGALLSYEREGVALLQAAEQLGDQLEAEGPTFLDLHTQTSRDRAVELTVLASLRLLREEDRIRYLQLAIFAEDTDIPLAMLSLLWDLTAYDTRHLCENLAALSLVKSYRRGSSLQLHDVIRDHLRIQLGDQIAVVNISFLERAKSLLTHPNEGWWRLSSQADYLWHNLCYHLFEAGCQSDLLALISDLRWGGEKIRMFGLAEYESDLARVDDPNIGLLRRALARKGHLLGPIMPSHSHADLLISRLSEVPELRAMAEAYAATLPRNVARLVNRWPIPPVDPALLRVLTAHTSTVTDCTISPDGSWLVTTGADQNVHVWSTATWAEQALLRGHQGSVIHCDFSPDGSMLATASNDYITRVWMTRGWTEVASLQGNAAVFGPNSGWLALSDPEGCVSILDTGTWRELALLRGHTDDVTGCAFSPDGEWLATTSADRTVRLWDTGTWRELALLRGHTDDVTGCAFSPDGEWLATTSADHNIRIWDSSTEYERGSTFSQNRSVTACAIDSKSRWILAVGNDHLVCVWNVESPPQERASLSGHEEAITDCAIAPDDSWFVTTSADRSVRIWDSNTWTQRLTLRGHVGSVTGCAVTPDGQVLATTDQEGITRIWDTERWRLRKVLHGHLGSVTGCAFSQDGAWLSTTGADRSARVWDTARWVQHVVLKGHFDVVTACTFSPDGAWLATTAADRSVHLWDTRIWRQRAELKTHEDVVTDCAFSPDGRWLATTCADTTLRIWESTSWQLAAAMRTNGRPDSVFWFPDGKAVCVGVVGGMYQFTFLPPIE